MVDLLNYKGRDENIVERLRPESRLLRWILTVVCCTVWALSTFVFLEYIFEPQQVVEIYIVGSLEGAFGGLFVLWLWELFP